VSPVEQPAPPISEDIHLPGPSIAPVLVAFGTALALLGITTFWPLIVAGGLLVLVVSVGWIRHTRRDVDALPPEH
jgi:hypothetical protein